jgi:hypothetical protein
MLRAMLAGVLGVLGDRRLPKLELSMDELGPGVLSHETETLGEDGMLDSSILGTLGVEQADGLSSGEQELEVSIFTALTLYQYCYAIRGGWWELRLKASTLKSGPKNDDPVSLTEDEVSGAGVEVLLCSPTSDSSSAAIEPQTCQFITCNLF